MTFERTIGAILNKPRHAMSKRLNYTFESIFSDSEEQPPTPSAFMQAREKLDPNVFVDLIEYINNIFYENKEKKYNIKEWKGHRLIGVDGSRIDIPENPENEKNFSRARSPNQLGGVLQGTVLCTYDTLNCLPLKVTLEKIGGELNPFLDEHFPYLTRDRLGGHMENAIYLFDRLFPSYKLFSMFTVNKKMFCARSKTSGTFNVLNKFAKGKKSDTILTFECPNYLKKYIRAHNYPEEVCLRVIKVILDTGETEVLITNLFDTEKYPASCFKELYFYRWPIEVGFGKLKTYMGLEYFTSSKIQFILQDLHAHFFLYAYCEMLKNKEDEGVKLKCREKGRKLEYQVSISNTITAVQAHVIELLSIPNLDMISLYKKLTKWIRNNLSPIRPDRHFKRYKGSDSKRLVFHTTRKKQYT